MIHIDIFTGIGGFALAVDSVWPGTDHVFCDNNKFCQEVLRKNFGRERLIYGDIRTLSRERFIADTNGNGQPGIGQEIIPSENGKQTLGNIEAGRRPASNTESGKPGIPAEWQGRKDIGGRGSECFILTGGFPCQPFSQAGKRKGTNDDRHLWPEMFRIIKDFRPEWVVAENVRGLLNIQQGMVFEQVCLDLESADYTVQAFIIPAVSVNAPHRRDRIWFIAKNSRCEHGERPTDGRKPEREVPRQETASMLKRSIGDDGKGITANAHGAGNGTSSSGDNGDRTPDSEERQFPENGNCRQDSNAGNSDGNGLQGMRTKLNGQRQAGLQHRKNSDWNKNWLEIAASLCGVDDGIPARMDGSELSKSKHRVERLKALGNAIVPQVAIEIMKAIKESENGTIPPH